MCIYIYICVCVCVCVCVPFYCFIGSKTQRLCAFRRLRFLYKSSNNSFSSKKSLSKSQFILTS